jgi:hypothetical protein
MVKNSIYASQCCAEVVGIEISPEECFAMGLKGRRYVEKHYNIPVFTNKLEEVIHETTD